MPRLVKIEKIMLREEQSGYQKGQFPCLRVKDDNDGCWWVICDQFDGRFEYEI